MSEKDKGVQTSVKTADADLTIFDLGVSTESVMTPDNSKGPKANIFSNGGPDQQFLDNNPDADPDDDDDDSGTDDPKKKNTADAGADAGVDDDTDDDDDDDNADDGKGKGAGAGAGAGAGKGGDQNLSSLDDDDPKNTGRPKIDKTGLVEFTKKLIEAKQLVPFDDEKPIDKYSMQDFEELFQANFDDQREQLRTEVSKEFWQSMPQEIQMVGQYLANGGNDLKQLFSALAQVEQTRELDPESEDDQELIAREYLRAKDFGNEEEITEEITSWKDLNKLGQKAKQFKPQLDKLKEDRVANQMATQEAARKKQQDAAKNYMKSVYDTLEPAELSGVKLDKKTQAMLYAGLVQANYPSVTGRQTNLLGHLMEKYQFVEPNHGLIAEVLWLLADSDGFKDQIRKSASSDANKKVVKLLKTEEGRKLGNTASPDDDSDNKDKGRKISRPVNVFSGKRS